MKKCLGCDPACHPYTDKCIQYPYPSREKALLLALRIIRPECGGDTHEVKLSIARSDRETVALAREIEGCIDTNEAIVTKAIKAGCEAFDKEINIKASCVYPSCNCKKLIIIRAAIAAMME